MRSKKAVMLYIRSNGYVPMGKYIGRYEPAGLRSAARVADSTDSKQRIKSNSGIMAIIKNIA